MLNETPADKLEAALAPILDIDGALRFLALDVALVNSDGYWTRASDYSLYQDEKGQLPRHPARHERGVRGGPQDAGRGFPPEFMRGGPGRGRGSGRDRAPSSIRSRLTMGRRAGAPRPCWPSLPRPVTFVYVRDIAERWPDWQKLNPALTNLPRDHQRRRQGGYPHQVFVGTDLRHFLPNRRSPIAELVERRRFTKSVHPFRRPAYRDRSKSRNISRGSHADAGAQLPKTDSLIEDGLTGPMATYALSA